ncbi:MAG: hypothetical protein AAGJ74_16595, partial [Pseudomonadota bacterium]
PMLKGSLRRNLALGTGRAPRDTALETALTSAGLSDTAARLGGLAGQVAEGGRNLTSSERTRLYLARGLIARPALALIDADEIGLDRGQIADLLDHFAQCGAASLIVMSKPLRCRESDRPLVMQRCDCTAEQWAEAA